MLRFWSLLKKLKILSFFFLVQKFCPSIFRKICSFNPLILWQCALLTLYLLRNKLFFVGRQTKWQSHYKLIHTSGGTGVRTPVMTFGLIISTFLLIELVLVDENKFFWPFIFTKRCNFAPLFWDMWRLLISFAMFCKVKDKIFIF